MRLGFKRLFELSNRGSMLDRSRLQWCIEILCVLSVKGTLRFKQIRRWIQLDKSFLVEYLRFLVDRDLVDEETSEGGKRGFTITNKGLSVLKILGPLVREAYRIEVQNFNRTDSIFSGLTLVSKK